MRDSGVDILPRPRCENCIRIRFLLHREFERSRSTDPLGWQLYAWMAMPGILPLPDLLTSL
jgi:hypothetical protein